MKKTIDRPNNDERRPKNDGKNVYGVDGPCPKPDCPLIAPCPDCGPCLTQVTN